jgi:translocation and assembly module TamB
MTLAVGQGRARVTLARTAQGLSGRAEVTSLDLGLLDPDLRGRADGVLTLAQRGGGLVGDAKARVSGLSGRDPGGAAPFGGDVTAAFGAGVVALGAQLSDGHGSSVSGDVRLPASLSLAPFKLQVDSGRPLTGRFQIDGEVGPLFDDLGGGGPSLGGRLVASGAIGGTLADPRLTGSARLDQGDIEDSALGLRLQGLSVRANLLGDAVDIAGFSASDGNKGSVTGAGRLSLVRDGASSFRLALKTFRLFDTTLGQATASGAVTVDRAANGAVRLGGALTIDHALISPRAAAPSGVVSMAVTEIHGPAEAGPGAAAAQDRTPPISLDLALKAPGGILIKGRGLNLEMSLDARVTGTSAAPVLAGAARVVRGDYDFAGQRFQVQDGGAVYLGVTPETVRLDLTASRDDPTLTASIKIGGTAAAPTLTLSSTPSLPKDEILSQVLFGASAAQLSGLQAAQLASAVAGLAGGGGLDVIGGLRGFAHLDRLAFDTAAATGVTVAGGKYISNKVYVELTNGTRTGQGAQVEWRVKKHLSVVSRVTSQGDNAVSLRWRKDY